LVNISTYVRFTGGPAPPRSVAENPNPGAELVDHLVAHLPGGGIVVRDAEDVEYAHEVHCLVLGKPYTVMVGYDWVTGDWWQVFYSRRLSWVKRLFGVSEDEEMRLLTSALATALDCLPRLREARWYRTFRGSPPRGDYSLRAQT
jgi:hypothetical protein